MAQRHSKYIPLISLTGDFLILNLLFIAGFWWHTGHENAFSAPYVLFYGYLNLAFFILLIVFGAYRFSRHINKKEIFVTYLKITVFFFFLFLLFFQLLPLPKYYPRDFIKILFPLFFILLLAWKYTVYYAFLIYRTKGYNYRNVLILGHTQTSRKLFNHLKISRWHGYRCMGFVDKQTNPEASVIGTWSGLRQIIEAHEIDELFIDMSAIPEKQKTEVLETIAEFPLKVHLIPTMGAFALKRAELIQMGEIPVIEIQSGALSLWYNQLLKRFFDIIFSGLVILGVLSWLSLILYLIDLLGDREGVFFRQKRTSIHGHPFTCIKYRSMHINGEADKKMATQNDKRVTPTGRFLRKTSLDELPQLFNVFLGQMSVVGPRPHMLLHTEQYRKKIKNFMIRHTVKPGITGLAQVNGYRGEIQHPSDLKQRLMYDTRYIENWSFILDLKIMLLTLWVLIKGQKQAY
jgi:putative colanic acid biosysnthesis UDP-glucose lipid carrier transferase